MALFKFTRGILEGRPIPVFTNGKMIRDFTYIDDIVDGVVHAIDHLPQPNDGWNGANPDPATSYAPYRIYSIGNHKPVELMQYIRVLEQSLGKKAALEMLPMQEGDVPATYADIADLQPRYRFCPDHVYRNRRCPVCRVLQSALSRRLNMTSPAELLTPRRLYPVILSGGSEPACGRCRARTTPSSCCV